jgi:hypothetical protein
MSSSGLLNALSTSDRQTMATRCPRSSTTGTRRSLCRDIRRATSLTSSSGLGYHAYHDPFGVDDGKAADPVGPER